MVVPVGGLIQDLVLVRREADGVRLEHGLGVRFVPMTGEAERRREGEP